MPAFSVNAHRLDPYKQFKFRVTWDGRPIVGVSRVSALRMIVTPLVAASAQPAVVAPAQPAPGPDAGVVIASVLVGMPWLAAATPSHPAAPAQPATVVTAGGATGIKASFVPVRLERGLTHDRAFESWVFDALGRNLAAAVKDIRVELYNEAGQIVMAYTLVGCVPVEYVPLPELDANHPGVAIESLTLAYQKFYRDDAVTEPVEPH